MRKVFLVFLLAISSMVIAQDEHFKLVSGNFNFLKDQQEVNVDLKFENVLFLKENYTESQYLEERKKDVLANPKRGEEGWEKWSTEWERYKNDEYINYLLKGLNKYSKKIEFTKGNSAKYMMIVDTQWIFPGWYGGMIGMSAEFNGTVKFVETSNPTHVLAVIELNKFSKFVKTKEFVMEYGRIAGGYEALGKFVAREIKKSK